MGRSPGLVTIAILKSIRSGHVYGADIVETTGLGGGTVYKTLSRLEERGWISGEWEDAQVAEEERRPRRRFYELTPEGVEATCAAEARALRLVGPPEAAGADGR